VFATLFDLFLETADINTLIYINALRHRHKATKKTQHPYHIIQLYMTFFFWLADLAGCSGFVFQKVSFFLLFSVFSRTSTLPLMPESPFPQKSHKRRFSITKIQKMKGERKRKAKKTLKIVANKIYESDRDINSFPQTQRLMQIR